MTVHGLPHAARAGAGRLVALLGFAIPVSVAFDAVVTALVVLAWLIAAPSSFGAYARTLRTLRPVLIASLLFVLLLLSTTYAPGPWKSAWGSASKYLDLALIPVFAWAAGKPEVRLRALYAFLAAIALSLIVSYGTAIGLWSNLPGLHNFPDYPVGFKLSVTHNLLVAFAGFVLLLLARELRRRGAGRLSLAALGFALLCIFNVLFVVIGRSGYLVLGALLVYFACTAVRGRRGFLIAALAIVALFASAYMGSGYFVARVQDVAWDLAQWKSGKNDDTSVGHRVVYYATTLEIVRDHPLTGVGAGGFAQAYADKVRGTPARLTVNPHNDYLMIAAQAGLPALGLLLALYGLLWRDAARMGSTFERDALRGLVLTVAIGGLFNSLLMDHVEGLLFAWIVGVLYGARAEQAL